VTHFYQAKVMLNPSSNFLAIFLALEYLFNAKRDILVNASKASMRGFKKQQHRQLQVR